MVLVRLLPPLDTHQMRTTIWGDRGMRTGQNSGGAVARGRRAGAGPRFGRLVLAGAALAVTTMVGTAGAASSAECTGTLIFLRLCGAAPAPGTTPTTAPPVLSLPPVTLPPATLPPVTVPPVIAAPPAPLSAPDAAHRLLDLVNGERQKAGLVQLSGRADITAIALAHSERMARAGDIFHSDSFFGSAVKTLLNAGARGENVAYNGHIDSAHARLMASPGHRANILDGRFTTAGFGVVRHADGRYFITQDFIQANGAPRPAAVARPAAHAASRSVVPAKPAAPKPTVPTTAAAPTTVPAPAATTIPVPEPEPSPVVLHTLQAPLAAASRPPQPAGEVSGLTTGAAVALLIFAGSACWVVPRRRTG